MPKIFKPKILTLLNAIIVTIKHFGCCVKLCFMYFLLMDQFLFWSAKVFM